MKTKHWIFLLGGIFILCLICMFIFPHIHNDSAIAEIYHDNELIKSIDLSKITEPEEIILRFDGNENIVLAEHGKISMKSASCPDGLCVKQGEIKNGIYPIICLPNHIVIKIISQSDSEVDTITK